MGVALLWAAGRALGRQPGGLGPCDPHRAAAEPPAAETPRPCWGPHRYDVAADLFLTGISPRSDIQTSLVREGKGKLTKLRAA